jgi:hypothetical protein
VILSVDQGNVFIDAIDIKEEEEEEEGVDGGNRAGLVRGIAGGRPVAG